MTRLSALQYPVLKLFAEGKPYLTIAECQKIDQRPFRSMLIKSREWIAYRPGRGFHITDAGVKAWDDFRFHEFYRSNPLAPLTRLFDPVAYNLPPWAEMRKQTKPHIVRRRSAA